jgi:hypothetical protein
MGRRCHAPRPGRVAPSNVEKGRSSMNGHSHRRTIDPEQAPAQRRSRLDAILQARISEAEHRILEQLACRHGVTLSEAVRAGVWNYLLARGHSEATPWRSRIPLGVRGGAAPAVTARRWSGVDSPDDPADDWGCS